MRETITSIPFDPNSPPVLFKRDSSGNLTPRPIDEEDIKGLDTVDKVFLLGTRIYDALGVANTAQKLFVDAVAKGRKETITENDLTQEDISVFKKLIQTKVAETGKSSGSIGYGDYKGEGISDRYNILGQFKYSVDEQGNIEIDDSYDFNRGGAWKHIAGLTTTEKLKRMLQDPEDYGNYVGQKSMTNGIPVKIKIPK